MLGALLKISIESIRFLKLSPESNAHKYAYLMRKDTKNQLKSYVNISLDDIELFLRK